MRKRTFLAGLPIYVAALAAQFVPQAQPASIAFVRQEQTPTERPVTPQAQNPQFAAAHKIKVWTNEDLIATRTPADIYIFEKEAKTVASEMEAFKAVASCFAFDQPEGSLEETQKAIAETLRSIRDGTRSPHVGVAKLARATSRSAKPFAAAHRSAGWQHRFRTGIAAASITLFEVFGLPHRVRWLAKTRRAIMSGWP
jgi:hypothetical protein